MPDQVLWRDRGGKTRTPGSVRVARLILLTLWASATVSFALSLYRVLSVESPTALQLVFLVLSTLCFAWVAIGSATGVLGFIWMVTGRTAAGAISLPLTSPHCKTALLFPVYREDPTFVAATIQAMAHDVVAVGAERLFDIFILSDTQDFEERQNEQRVYDQLRALAGVPVYARWRATNAGKKAGNIREWVERFGGTYPYFVILDADSIMTATTLLRLASALDARPQAGLIQTVPKLVGGQTLFARLQQFAANTYGPLVAAGLAAWHGPGSNYWGHNAIIRTHAFASCAGLPLLPGRPPMGGQILSHDFVEAALLRRGGWEVHLVPSIGGSYEGCPPTLRDLIIRDRRWAQGNLQHIRLIAAHGLAILSRIHLALGAFSYIASPLWALSLVVGVVLAVQAKYATPAYFGSEASLFPKWPVFDAQLALSLFLATVLVVHLPKLLGAAWALRSRSEQKRHGGVLRVVGGVIFESALSTLIAPVLMITQTAAVLSIFAGSDTGWTAQRRITGHSTAGELLLQHRWHLAWGVLGVVICWSISIGVLAWMSPILLGLICAPLLSRWVSQNAHPHAASLLATPEDRDPGLQRMDFVTPN